ncbi:MAG: homoserine dehydrogenase, partial [Muribaculaceae bacterium]|nr:homoserine dehydrogenase [Muribaculaceae bacterium]
GGYPTGSAILSDITASQYDYKYEYKKGLTHPNDLPQFTNDVHFRVYYRYQSPEDLNLINFESISEKYISEGFNYVVGVTSLESLHKVASKLRERDVFVAAYPPD